MFTDKDESWKRLFTETVSSIDDAFDAGIRRLRKRFGREGVPKIQPYIGYASDDQIHLHGRVLTNPPIDPDFRKNGWFENLSSAMQRFASDEVPGVAIRALFGGIHRETITDQEGYFNVALPRERTDESLPFWSQATLQITDHDAVTPERSTAMADVMVTPSDARYVVISDVDDTILRTGATDILTMAKLTFFSNARTRAPLPGIASWYEIMQNDGTPDGDPTNPIFYVSSSPWNLYDLLEDFLDLNTIPKGPLLLRDLGFDDNKFLKSGHDHKLVKARRIFDMFDELPIVLSGDSGQDDARLYAEAAKEYGQRILAIFIRDIDPMDSSEHDEKVDRYVHESAKAGVPMYLIKSSVDAATIAAEHGVISKGAIAEIEAATRRDEQRDNSLIAS